MPRNLHVRQRPSIDLPFRTAQLRQSTYGRSHRGAVASTEHPSSLPRSGAIIE